MAKKYKIVLCDFHMGGGRRLPNGTTNYLENFFNDREFTKLMDHYSTEPWADKNFELILNGDFFEHLEVIPDESDPDLLTERVAVERQRKIIEGHPKVFEAMHRFNSLPNHRITFMLGNHDAGLLWPAVQSVLREAIGGEVRVFMEKYEFNGVRVEHGHQYQADSAFNEKRYFLTKGLTEPIINLPWGCYFIVHYVNKVRKARPYFGRVYPMRYFIRWALFHETMFALKHIATIIYYFFSLRFVHSKRRRSSFWRTLKLVKEAAVEANLDKIAKKILLTNPGLRILIMGHSHSYRSCYYGPGKLYINGGTWTERVSLDPANFGRIICLAYVWIQINEEGRAEASLKEWIGTHDITKDIHNV